MPMRGRSFFDSCAFAIGAVNVYAAQIAAEAFAVSVKNCRRLVRGMAGMRLESYG